MTNSNKTPRAILNEDATKETRRVHNQARQLGFKVIRMEYRTLGYGLSGNDRVYGPLLTLDDVENVLDELEPEIRAKIKAQAERVNKWPFLTIKAKTRAEQAEHVGRAAIQRAAIQRAGQKEI